VIVLVLAAACITAGRWGYVRASDFLFNSGYFEIRTIEINGLSTVSRTEISSLLPFREGDNLFSVWLGAAERNLRKCKPELKNISMRRTWHGVTVSVEERVPVAYVTVGGIRCGVDADNVPFPLHSHWVNDIHLKLPEIVVKEDAERREVLEFIALLGLHGREVYDQIVRFSVQPKDTVVFDLKDGTQVLWGPVENKSFKPKLEKLAQVKGDALKRFNRLEYINLCYFDDGRVVVKPLAAVQTTDMKRRT
jgi:cell division protein FtsQ